MTSGGSSFRQDAHASAVPLWVHIEHSGRRFPGSAFLRDERDRLHFSLPGYEAYVITCKQDCALYEIISNPFNAGRDARLLFPQ